MESKTAEWRPGPAVCRCCLAEGCYKDISTEYFWMGKREVYAEMLLETLDHTIAYSTSGGPNSNSRLICEQCIAKLRDATEFKRQVQECERTFMQWLDPGNSVAEVTVSGVKLEQVKKEKNNDSDGDDDFDDQPDFGDDDGYDDVDDDVPLTKYASKTPKKEPVDLQDLLDKANQPTKRKSTTKVKSTAKKAKVTKEKATSSKPKPEKKKKGTNTAEVVVVKKETEITNNVKLIFPKVGKNGKRSEGKERRAAFKMNIKIIMASCTAYPFKYKKGAYLCFFCKSTFVEPEKMREHTQTHHSDHFINIKKYDPIKMDFGVTVCKICGDNINDYYSLKSHLGGHGRVLNDTYGESVLPYKLIKGEHSCQICGKRYEMFLSLHKHMNDHYEHFICETCGKRFATMQRMLNHSRTHERRDFPCKHCGETLSSYSSLYTHVSKIHRSNKRYKCPLCDEKFASYKFRMKHLNTVHGEKTALFPCPMCPKVFDLCSQRTSHIRFQHLQERNHSCDVCGMKFFSNYALQEHSVKHVGARIYHCDVCKKSYARIKTLREHMRIHTNDRRFVCPVCGQSFIQKCSLKQHVRVHHPMQVKTEPF